LAKVVKFFQLCKNKILTQSCGGGGWDKDVKARRR